MKQTKRRPREFWQDLFAQVEAGGGVTAVARRHGVKARTLRWWCWQLRRDRGAQGRPALLPVVVAPRVVEGTTRGSLLADCIEVVSGDITVRLMGDVEVTQVAALVAALRGC